MSDECHNCAEELDKDDDQTIAELTDYYTALDAGHGRYSIIGYLIAVGSFISLIVLGIIIAFVNLTSLFESVIAITVLLVLTLMVVGLSLFIGSWGALNNGNADNETAHGVVFTTSVGFFVLVLAGILVGILSVIPLLNILVGLILMGLLLISPWLTYKSYVRYQVHRPEAIASLMDFGSGTRQATDEVNSTGSSHLDGGEVSFTDQLDRRSETARSLALEMLAAAPVSTGTGTERDLLIGHLQSDTDTAYGLIDMEPFVDAVATTFEETSYSDQAQLLDLLLGHGATLCDEGRFEDARTCYETVDALLGWPGAEEYEDDVKSGLERTRDLAASARFGDVADEIRDTVRSAEGAKAAGDYARALERYQDAKDRLPQQFSGNPELESEYRSLVDRLEEGLSETGRDLILSVLPESPSDIERDILVATLPTNLGDKLDDIYDNSLEDTIYLNQLNENSIDDIERATVLVKDYRDMRRRLRDADGDPGPYINRLENIISTTLATNESPKPAAADATGASRTALTNGRIYVQTVERLSELEEETHNSEFVDCLKTIRTVLRDRGKLQSEDDLIRTEMLVDRLEPIQVYVDTFPSLSIDVIIKEITAGIESGNALDPDQFTRQFDRIDRLVEREKEQLTEELESFLEEWQGHPAIDHQAWNRAISKARSLGNLDPVIEPFRTMKRMEGTMWSYEHLQQFSWEEFEHLIANLYTQQGYETTVTSGSRDMGVDVWAENASERLAIQVKQFARGNTVGREVVQKLESTLARGEADRIIVVTSSSFADTTRQYAAGSIAVELIDGQDSVDHIDSRVTPFDDGEPNRTSCGASSNR